MGVTPVHKDALAPFLSDLREAAPTMARRAEPGEEAAPLPAV